MLLLADHCVPTDVVDVLRTLGLARAADETVFDHARRHGQTLVTTDRDFGNIVRFPIRQSPGIVILELEGVSKTALLARVQSFFKNIRPSALRGRLTLLEPSRVRVWPTR